MTSRHIRLKEWMPNIDRTFEPSEQYITACIPNALKKEGYRIRTNQDGLILPVNVKNNEENLHKSSIILGDSIPECLYMHEEFRIESQLAKRKNRNYFNAAYSGATSVDILNTIINKIIPLHPEKICLISGVYDSQIMNKGFFSIDSHISTISPQPHICNLQNFFLKDREKILEVIVSLLSHFGIELILCTVSHRFNPNDPFCKTLNIETNPLLNKICLVNETTRNIAKNFGLKLIDFEKIFFENFNLHYDHAHLTPKGALLISDILMNMDF